MKNKLFILFVFIIPFSFVQSQNKISFHGGYGHYLSNSENSLPLMDNEKFKSYFNFGFAYQRDNLFGLNFAIEYNYNNSKRENALIFIRTSADSPDPVSSFGAHVTLTNHNIDLNYINKINNVLTWGAGPSFVITNRLIETDDLVTGTEKAEGLYDKLASSGIGLNTFISASLPITADNSLFAFSKIKVRYTHAIWFDEGLRKLDDYNQDFFTGELNIGLGYSF